MPEINQNSIRFFSNPVIDPHEAKSMAFKNPNPLSLEYLEVEPFPSSRCSPQVSQGDDTFIDIE